MRRYLTLLIVAALTLTQVNACDACDAEKEVEKLWTHAEIILSSDDQLTDQVSKNSRFSHLSFLYRT